MFEGLELDPKMFHVKPFHCPTCEDTVSGAFLYLSKGGCPDCDSPVLYRLNSTKED